MKHDNNCVMKIVDRIAEHGKLRKNIEVLRGIKHENLVTLHRTFQTAEKVFIVTEYVKGNDLASLLKKVGKLQEKV